MKCMICYHDMEHLSINMNDMWVCLDCGNTNKGGK